jgi:hypothetical protein
MFGADAPVRYLAHNGIVTQLVNTQRGTESVSREAVVAWPAVRSPTFDITPLERAGRRCTSGLPVRHVDRWTMHGGVVA